MTLIGGGSLGEGDLAFSLAHAPLLVAADGGAGQALAAGHMPRAVFGDLDSLELKDRARIPEDRLFEVADQNSTDFDKALLNIEAPLVLAIGFLGGRIDHQMTAFNILVRHAQRPCILIGEHELIFHLPPKLSLELRAGDTVSLFPMRPVSGRSTGLAWPIDGLDFAPDGFVGTSNRALGSVHIEMFAKGALLVVPRDALDAVMQGFQAISSALSGQ